jgi:penicillin-binding protein 2
MSTVAQPSSVWREQRVRVARWAIMCTLAAIIAKLWTMQVLQVDKWSEESQRALTTNNALPAARGIIADRNGAAMASNDAQWTACVTLEDIEDYRKSPPPWRSPIRDKPEEERAEANLKDPPESLQHICRALANIINASPDRSGPKPRRKPVDWRERLDMLCKYAYAPYKAAPFASDLDHASVMQIMEQLPGLRGVTVVRQFQRRYDHPEGSNAFHLLGYVQRVTAEEAYLFEEGYEPSDVLGKEGIERYYEPVLRGVKGREVSTPDQPRQLDPPPQPGQDLTLCIDSRLQAAMEASLARCVEFYGGDAGAAVAMDPQSGDVYGMASYPAFRSEWFAPESPAGSAKEITKLADGQKRHPWSNQAISFTRAPASTFKFVTLTAALEEDVIDPDTFAVNCAGKMVLGSSSKRCWQRQGHGYIGVTGALVRSCNIFFYTLGIALGEERLVKWTRNFGFGQKTGIDLPNEASGIVGDRLYVTRVLGEDGWFSGHSANLAIGQGPIMATPLQVAVATAMVANGGRRVVPRVGARLNKAGVPQKPIALEKEPVTIPLKPRTLAFVRNGMRGVVSSPSGTAYLAFSGENAVNVPVAGKTGSSEIGAADAWFTCYAPFVTMNPGNVDSVERANSTPKIVVTVLIVNGGHGGDSAAPVARDIIAAAFDERGNFRISPAPVR